MFGNISKGRVDHVEVEITGRAVLHRVVMVVLHPVVMAVLRPVVMVVLLLVGMAADHLVVLVETTGRAEEGLQ